MKKRNNVLVLLFSTFLLSALLCGAMEKDERSPEIRKQLAAFTPGTARETVYNTGFEPPFGRNGIKVRGYSIAREGINGSSALKFTRTNPKEYNTFSIPLALKPNRKYMIEFYARGEQLRRQTGNEGIGLACIEYTSRQKWVYGEYPSLMPEKDWKKFTLNVLTALPGNKPFDRGRIVFYLRKGWTGTVWIDDLTVTSGDSETHAVVLNEPKMLTFRNGSGKISLACDPRFADKLGAHLTLRNGGRILDRLLVSDKSGLLSGDFGTLAPGPAMLEIQLLDRKKKLLLEKQKFHLRVLPADEPVPSNAALLDKYGRLIVNGKPFMPIGVYASMSEKSFRMIAEAGFNCLQGYNNFWMAPEKKRGSQLANILAMMDDMNRHGLKFIFSLLLCEPGTGGTLFEGKRGELDVIEKIVPAIREHPALLAYYIGDERPLASLPAMLSMRETINRHDAWHPTWAVSMLHQNVFFPQYGTCMDVTGIDSYPFGIIHSPHNVIPVLRGHADAYRQMNYARLPHWCVPQMFSHGIYKAGDSRSEYEKYRWPTREEMRMQTLLHAILGAKGFIFYSQFDILKGNRWEPGISEKRWAMAAELAAMLRKLEPFLMGIRKVPAIGIAADKKENLSLRAFAADDGTLCIPAVSFGPVRAIISVPPGMKFRSEYGRFRKLPDGRWQFNADGMDSDILFPAR